MFSTFSLMCVSYCWGSSFHKLHGTFCTGRESSILIIDDSILPRSKLKQLKEIYKTIITVERDI